MLQQAGANYDREIAVRANSLDDAGMTENNSLDGCVAQRHIQRPRTPTTEGSRVQNGHTHSSSPPVSPYRLSLCLLTVGWSERELVRRTGEHRNTVRRWLAGESAVDPDVARWLEVLMAAHLAHPSPRRNSDHPLSRAAKSASRQLCTTDPTSPADHRV